MEQLTFFDIPSPCIGICQTDKRGFCKGCFRSRDERFSWLNLSNSEKSSVIQLALNRKKRRIDFLKSQDLSLLYEQASNSSPLFDKDTASFVDEAIHTPEILDKVDSEKLDLLWWFLNTFVFPFLVSCIAASFMEHRAHIYSYFSNISSLSEVNMLANNFPKKIESNNWVVISVKNLNFREGPSNTAPILSVLKLGDVVEVIDKNNDWIYVRACINGEVTSGWLYKKFTVAINSKLSNS